MTLRATVPVFTVNDVTATMRWYADHLGFTCEPFPEEPPHLFAILRKDDVEIFLQRLPGYQKPDLFDKREGGVWNAYVRMDSVRPWYEQLRASPNVTIVESLCHREYGQTEFVIKDPNGYVIVFAEWENVGRTSVRPAG